MVGYFSKIFLALMLWVGMRNANGQWTYPNCPNVSASDFTQDILINRQSHPSLLEPLKMDFAMNGNKVDIYFIQKAGEVKYYNGATENITTIGNVNPETTLEDGLIGIALPRTFSTDNPKYIYLFYSHSSGFRLSRFEVDADTKMMGTETVLLTIPSGRGRWHTAGAMKFDDYGDLWINIGDNETAQKGPANTNDLRRGIIRIHPEPDGSYSIPEGNLWEFASEYFEGQGNSSVAAEYRDESLTRREIFAMGTRNAYTLTIDPVRQWATYGDCGPDFEPYNSSNPSQFTEEHNVLTHPAFMGWPYWSANQHAEAGFPAGYDEPGESNFWVNTATLNPDAPVNNHPDAGVNDLLPATPGTNNYGHACAMTGPIYRYDGDLPNEDKFPPHMNRVWFITDWNQDWIRAVKLNDQGEMQGSLQDFNINVKGVLDFQQGPDGALYVLNYGKIWNNSDANTSISRISYTGSCHDPDLKLETVSVVRRGQRHFFNLTPHGIEISQRNVYQVTVIDIQGRKWQTLSGEGERTFRYSNLLPEEAKQGVYFITVESAGQVQTQKFVYQKR